MMMMKITLSEHFSSDQPGNGTIAQSKEDDKEERGGDEEATDLKIVSDDNQHRHHQRPQQAGQLEHPPAQPVHERYGDECHGDHDSSNTQSRVPRLVIINTRRFEELYRVVEDSTVN